MVGISARLKPLLSYYGGKQKLAKEIIARIPANHVLCASIFAGGAAEFFAKEPPPVEVLNDTNKELINFYKVIQNRFLDDFGGILAQYLKSRQKINFCAIIL